MKNLNIRSKVLIASVLPVAWFAVVIIWAISTTSHNASEEASIEAGYALKVLSEETLKEKVHIILSSLAPVYKNSNLSQDQIQKQVLTQLKNIEYSEANYLFVVDPQGKMLVNSADQSLEGTNVINKKDLTGKTIFKDMIELSNNAGGYYQYVLKGEEGNEPTLTYVQKIDTLGWVVGGTTSLNFINEQVQTLNEILNDEVKNSFIIEIIAIVISLIIAIALGIFFANLIANPIKQLVTVIKKIEQGDLTARMAIKTNDEIGEFTKSFNLLIEKIHQILSEVNNSVNALSGSAATLNKTAQNTYEAIKEQDAETNAIAASVESLSVNVKVIAENGVSVKDSASDAGSKTDEGAISVRENLESVSLLAQEITQAAQSVNAVEQRTDEIQTMLEVIHSVTEQTNLLALNAAIEAARAGEQGRGFAVVADEVRSLAMRSAESAEEINKIITGLTEGTKSAVATMNASNERSEKNQARTKDVAKSLEDIQGVIYKILDETAQIAEATVIQGEKTQEIVDNLNRIQSISSSNAKQMKNNKDSSEQLDKLGKKLLDHIGYFKFG